MSERRIRDAERRECGYAKSDTADEISAVGRLGLWAVIQNNALIQIAGEKPGDGIERAIVIEILVAAIEKPHEMFRLVGEVEQRFAHDVRNDPVVYAMHDHDRRGDLADAQVGPELILH